MTTVRRIPFAYRVAAFNVVVAFIAVVALALAYPSFKRTGDYARQGRLARERTVKIAPITCLNYRDQLARGVITRKQFGFVVSAKRAGFPGRCPLKP